ncbi:MAG TPA: cupin domain-containing protein [Acidimicrobiales bacterium]|nr:cupin domain-containing protein [Acidimicrobiales bacterium]
MARLADLRGQLGLEPIPVEGGWFRVTWRSGRAGAILALFTDEADGFSALHRLSVAELWFFHAGDPFGLVLLRPDGSSADVVLGAATGAGQVPQVAVEPGTWMGGAPLGSWTLLSTVTVPPFTDDAFTPGSRAGLVAAYPDRGRDIERLTRE